MLPPCPPTADAQRAQLGLSREAEAEREFDKWLTDARALVHDRKHRVTVRWLSGFGLALNLALNQVVAVVVMMFSWPWASREQASLLSRNGRKRGLTTRSLTLLPRLSLSKC